MAILVNMGQRGFVLKEGFLAPGKEIIVEKESADKLAKMYGKELKVIYNEDVKVEAPKQQESPKEEPKEELEEVKPAKRGGRRKKAQEVQED